MSDKFNSNCLPYREPSHAKKRWIPESEISEQRPAGPADFGISVEEFLGKHRQKITEEQAQRRVSFE